MTYCVCTLSFIWPVSSQFGSVLKHRAVSHVPASSSEDSGVATFGSDQVKNTSSFSFDPSHTVQQFCLGLNFQINNAAESFPAAVCQSARRCPWCCNLSNGSLPSTVLKHSVCLFCFYFFSVAAARCADVISAQQQQHCYQKFRHRTHPETGIFSDSPLKGTQLSIKTF